jgi:hypothetical protein
LSDSLSDRSPDSFGLAYQKPPTCQAELVALAQCAHLSKCGSKGRQRGYAAA